MALLVHGTAIVIGTTGLVLIGPPGSGKSSLAIRLMTGARRSGYLAALVSDDQIILEAIDGRLIATAPATIKGMIELRGSGIGCNMTTIEAAVLHLALQPIHTDSANRIPEGNQCWTPVFGVSLPLHFIDRSVSEPFGWLEALIPGFPVSGAFQL